MSITRVRIYVDTSVVGGCHDDEFLESSQELFDRFRNGSAVLVHSVLLRRELVRAPRAVRETIEQLPDEAKEMTSLTEDAVRLSDAYIEAGAIETEFRSVARHIALATCAEVDILASWGFRHMVNRDRIKAYNRVNLRMGRTELRILHPVEIERARQSASPV